MDTAVLEQKLTGLQGELKGYFDQAKEQERARGTIDQDTKTAIEALQKQVDAIDAKIVQATFSQPEGKSFSTALDENESLQRLLRDGNGKASIKFDAKQAAEVFETKTTLTTGTGSLGAASVSGVLPFDRTTGVVAEARRRLRVRDLLSSRPTTFAVIDFVKVNSPLVNASPQVEGSSKFENAVTFTTHSERVKTLATFIRATKQIIEDMTELKSFLMASLPYYTNRVEETQLLSGDGTGENLNGLITQATAFNTALLSNSQGWNKIDQIGRAIQQVTVADEIEPTFVTLNPTDWWDMRLTKDSYGRYILGDPQTDVRPRLFGMVDLVPTTAVTAGTFLVGTGLPVASEIRDRMGMQVDISTEDADNFTKNLVTIRAEKRLALVVYRPGSYITGTFNRSPA
jgi:HK97 family phage major capsid protein